MIEKTLFSREDIQTRLDSLAIEINNYYGDEPILVIPLLRGGFMFASDLIRRLTMPVEVDFMTTASYGFGKSSTGDVKLYSDLRANVGGKNVLVVDDIIDSGYTLKFIKEHISKHNPKSLKLCTMLDKPSRRKVDIKSDFVGFEVDDLFIVGYGLDYENLYRNKDYIFTFDDIKKERDE